MRTVLPVAFALGMVVALVAAMTYWTIVISEGAYFGRRLVSYLYDRGAETYDDVKEFDATEDAWFLGIPMARNLERVQHPFVLDLATGTGRMALSLLRQLTFDGRVVGLDLSYEMLRIAQKKSQRYSGRVALIWKNATQLPFADESFDAVACVEALEFLPEPRTTLSEMVRVLRPGGSFLVTNRIGWERYLMPGRAFDPEEFESILRRLGLESIWTKPWQTYYDLVWARKPGILADRETPPVLGDTLRCPLCGYMPLDIDEDMVTCPAHGHKFRKKNGIVDFEVSA